MTATVQEQEDYKKAERAYIDGKYQQAVSLTAHLVSSYPDNPKYHLLHGHVNLALESCQEAVHEYEAAIRLTHDTNILEHATWGINEAQKRMDDNSYQEPTFEESAFEESGIDPFADSDTDFDFTYEQDDAYDHGNATVLIAPNRSSNSAAATFVTAQDGFNFEEDFSQDDMTGDGFMEEFEDYDDTGTFRTLQEEDITSGFPGIEEHEPISSESLNSSSTAIGEVPSMAGWTTSGDTGVGAAQFRSQTSSPPDFLPVEQSASKPGKLLSLLSLDSQPMGLKMTIIPFISLLVGGVAGVTFMLSSPPDSLKGMRDKPLAVAGVGLLASSLSTFLLGTIVSRKIKRTADNLQLQMESVIRGNMNVRALVLSTDELGLIATGFNRMMQAIVTTTSEVQHKVDDLEQAKEDLHRQVIRLLDDVEGAARGDLTVQAEVTADVLGAVADSFNLTIENLRQIVQQVREAARQVNKGAAENETFARSLSSDALRQAEELSVTLNSVQMMTESIQRVAESAREAEQVAKLASQTAIRGGDAVQTTVAGILNIRETVAESTRKVKRLGEASQEISKIVGLITQIASRTNLLALNASIVAARAGEAGKEFAIISDEVRQLADRAAKSSKEIEQIVLQIQSETNNVQLAMDKGTEQVIDGMRRAEQAAQALNDIIQVSQRIDNLVRSITEDTIRQTETSRTVAQVMQSVELTAQETSQESQRVSGSLQNLVSVARGLQDSVERFRVDPDKSASNRV